MGSDWKMSAIKALDTYERKQQEKDENERLDRERRRERDRDHCRRYLALLLGVDPLQMPEGSFVDNYGVVQPEPKGQDLAWTGVFDGVGWKIDSSSARSYSGRDKPPTSWSGVRARWGGEQWHTIAGKVALGRFLKKNGY